MTRNATTCTGAALNTLLVIAATTALLTGTARGANVGPLPKPSRTTHRLPAAPLKAPAVVAAAIRITASAQATTDQTLLRAYETMNAGQLAVAEADYAQVLKFDANNADALHGAAVVALKRGQFRDAEDFYRRAVHADPRDAIALAGLVGLRGHADPVDAESRLKSLIADQPWQHVLHFALGNIYATAGRWSEAQQAFFNACNGAAEHPDYLFNHAVSLDHLRKSKLAAQYYGYAVAAADKHPAAFDTTQATARLRALLR